MRNIFLPVILLCLFAAGATAQNNKSEPAVTADTLRPYQKYPSLPAFNILLMDSSTIFNTYNIPKGKYTAIVFFDPDCKHCKSTFKRLEAGWDSVKNINFYLITPTHSWENLRKFYADFHIEDYKNIKAIGRDYEFFFFTNYGTKFLPDVVVYDEHKKLIKLIEGEFNASDLYNLTH
jgi:Thioredoxin-like domain